MPVPVRSRHVIERWLLRPPGHVENEPKQGRAAVEGTKWWEPAAAEK